MSIPKHKHLEGALGLVSEIIEILRKMDIYIITKSDYTFIKLSIINFEGK